MPQTPSAKLWDLCFGAGPAGVDQDVAISFGWTA
jgi:hypothetical protein